MHKEIARWLYDKIISEGDVYQYEAVDEIAQKYGEEFTYTNEQGNPAIDRKVLYEFGKLKGDDIVWDRAELFWHKETETDKELMAQMPDLPKIDIPKMDDMLEFELEPIEIDNDIKFD